MKQSEGLPGIDELRTARTWVFMARGDRSDTAMAAWADEIADLVRIHGGGNRRIACDRLDGAGTHALQARGLTYVEGTRITEIARSIKSKDEIELMRWTIRVCEAGMARIYDHSVPWSGWRMIASSASTPRLALSASACCTRGSQAASAAPVPLATGGGAAAGGCASAGAAQSTRASAGASAASASGLFVLIALSGVGRRRRPLLTRPPASARAR